MAHERQPHRRAVLRGAAWTAPAIVLATAAPATAASGGAQVTTRISPTTDDPGHNLHIAIQFDNSGPGSTGRTTVHVTCLPTTGVVDPTPPSAVSSGWVAGKPTPTDLGNGQIFPFTSADGIRGIPSGVAATFLFFDVKVGPDSVLQSAGTITTSAVPTSGTVVDGVGAWG
ncbi:MAG: hypothetical protein WB471_14080 [Nocardioides sp.]